LPQQITYRLDDRLYLSITDLCTLECTFCPKTRGDYRIGDCDLSMDHRPDADEIVEAMGDPAGYSRVVFSGFGEPTLRLNLLLTVAGHIKARGGRVEVTTDGLANLVHDRDVLEPMTGRVDALSVSMNAQDEATYERICRPNLPGSFEAMLRFLREAPVRVPEVTATAIEGVPGVDIPACERLAKRIGVGFRKRTLGRID
jgi:TatD family-associated radical SAM protein